MRLTGAYFIHYFDDILGHKGQILKEICLNLPSPNSFLKLFPVEFRFWIDLQIFMHCPTFLRQWTFVFKIFMGVDLRDEGGRSKNRGKEG